MPGSVIVGSARTPIGKLSGALAGFSAADLGGLAITAALERAGVGAEQIDYVLMGHVLQAGKHLDLVGLHQRTAGRRGQGQRCELVGRCAGDDRVADGFDLALSSRHASEATGR